MQFPDDANIKEDWQQISKFLVVEHELTFDQHIAISAFHALSDLSSEFSGNIKFSELDLYCTRINHRNPIKLMQIVRQCEHFYNSIFNKPKCDKIKHN